MVRVPKQCNKKPRYSDGITVHPYCGRTCAKLAKGNAPANKNPPVPTNPSNATNPPSTTAPANTSNPLATASTNTRGMLRSTSWNPPSLAHPSNSNTSANPTNTLKNKSSSVSRTISSGPTCQTPGCSSPVYVDPNGVPSDYCTKTHRQCVFRLFAPFYEFVLNSA